jgi:uncharacterized protein YggE
MATGSKDFPGCKKPRANRFNAFNVLTFLTHRAFIAAALLAGAGALAQSVAQEFPMPDQETMESAYRSILTVTGHGEVNARPDTADVRLGIEGQADSAAAAQQSVNSVMQKVLEQIKKVGIKENAIQTAGLSLSPVYAPQKPGQEGEPPRVVGYRASNSIRVELHDLSLVGQVIDAGLGAGANRLEGVSFGLEKELQYRTRALQIAAQEARTKAEGLAETLNLRLVALSKVLEGGAVPYRPHPVPMMAGRAGAAPTPVEPGQLKVEATVTLEYEIESAGESKGR